MECRRLPPANKSACFASKHARFFSEEVKVMGKGDNRQKNDKKNKKVKKDAKKPGIPAAVKKA